MIKLYEVQEQAEQLKEKIWAYLEQYGSDEDTDRVRMTINELLDSLDCLDERTD